MKSFWSQFGELYVNGVGAGVAPNSAKFIGIKTFKRGGGGRVSLWRKKIRLALLAVFDTSHEDIIGNLVTQRKFLAGGVGLVRLLVGSPLCGTQLQ